MLKDGFSAQNCDIGSKMRTALEVVLLGLSLSKAAWKYQMLRSQVSVQLNLPNFLLSLLEMPISTLHIAGIDVG